MANFQYKVDLSPENFHNLISLQFFINSYIKIKKIYFQWFRFLYLQNNLITLGHAMFYSF